MYAIVASDFNIGNIAWKADKVSGICDKINVRKLLATKEHLAVLTTLDIHPARLSNKHSQYIINTILRVCGQRYLLWL